MEYDHHDHQYTLHLDTPPTDIFPRLLCHLLHRCVCAHTDIRGHSHSSFPLRVTNQRHLNPKRSTTFFSQGATLSRHSPSAPEKRNIRSRNVATAGFPCPHDVLSSTLAPRFRVSSGSTHRPWCLLSLLVVGLGPTTGQVAASDQKPSAPGATASLGTTLKGLWDHPNLHSRLFSRPHHIVSLSLP